MKSGGKMTTNQEIEFKTIVTKEKYEELLKSFDLENNIFSQTNHYFDDENLSLMKEKTVLRIRQKGNYFKLTKKSQADIGSIESHVLVKPEMANEMIKNGFDANIIDLNYKVKKISELTTYRVSTTYKDGTIFFDKSVYYGNTDYEVEYEVDTLEQGQIDFNSFLLEYNIPYKQSIRKSQRAYSSVCKK